MAALLLVPDGVISHHSAAVLRGACAPETDDIHVSVRKDPHVFRPRRSGLVVHQVTHLEQSTHEGLPVTPPGRTFLDLAAHLELAELVASGDALVRRAGATPGRLADLADTSSGRGVRLAREAAALVRSGVDSPMESRLRMLLVLAGLPEPVVGSRRLLRRRRLARRPDLHYPEQKIAIEYDGRHHLEDTKQWHRDIGRRENLEGEGWRVRVVTARDVYKSPFALLGRIHGDRVERGHPDVPARVDLTRLPSWATRPARTTSATPTAPAA
jgi:hypothetical protein